MKTLYSVLAVLIVLLTAGYSYLEFWRTPDEVIVQVLSFEDCVKAGYIVMESYPRQCKTPDDRTFTEEIRQQTAVYENASQDMIQVDLPYPGAVVGKTFSVLGKARGNWYFEASFPVNVLDKDGRVLYQGPAQAQGDWMTTEFVPFKIEVVIPESYIGPAKIVLKNDNSSGDPTKDASVTIPIVVEY